MLTTTFRLLHSDGACKYRYRILATKMGGVTKYGRDTPIPLTVILDQMGLDDALWSLRAVNDVPENIHRIVCLAHDFARHVQIFWNVKFPDDERPRTALHLVQKYLSDPSSVTAEELSDAASGAGDAFQAAGYASRAAGDAFQAAGYASSSAGDAARAAGYASSAAWCAASAAECATRAAWYAAWAAGDAARAAGYASRAAGFAARAAWCAASAAETEWLTAKFREVVG